MPKWKGYPFDGSNLIDGRFDTSWQPAKKDTIGVGEWVELDLGAAYQIDHIEIVQGLQKVDPKLGDLFCRNNRFAEAYLLFDDGTHAPYSAFAGDRVSKVELFYCGEALPDNASGKPAEPAYVELIKEDRQHQNDCWEQLGKKRPEYPPE